MEIDKIRSDLEEYKKKNKRRVDEDIKTEKKEAELISEILEDGGVTDLWTNNYVFKFTYLDKNVSFVNQSDRICGSIMKTEYTKEERGILRNIYKIEEMYGLKSRLVKEIKEDLGIKQFCINGKPKKSVNVLLKKMELEDYVKSVGGDRK